VAGARDAAPIPDPAAPLAQEDALTTNDDTPLRSTPLTAWHRDHGARMVPFAGFEMPVQYRGVLAEHAAVRERVGLFDITHMGEILATGQGVEAWLDGLCTNRVSGIPDGKVVYTAMCRPDGGVLDDMLIYRLGRVDWMIVCNASNHDKIAAWVVERAAGVPGVTLDDASDRTAMIAVQGPEAAALTGRLAALGDSADALDALDFYTAFVLPRPGGRWIVSRTGYTGERGYELYVPNDDALPLWEELLARGGDLGVEPIGLAARDTLRFEPAYCLYGHELSEDWTPLEAGIGWAVRLKDRDFVGRAALQRQMEHGLPRQLVGLEVAAADAAGRERPAPIARQGAPVYCGGQPAGFVTSGTKSPSLGRSLALALIDAGCDPADLSVEIRDRRHPVRTVPYPFLAARVKGDPRAAR
jgi:aminomethyltransferase